MQDSQGNPVTWKTAQWKLAGVALASLLLLTLAAVWGGRLWLRHTLRAALPQTSGRLRLSGLHAPVTVARDTHGVPVITAGNLDDLVFAQGFVTAQDRLWQMDMLRRHAAGRMAEVLGSGMVEHDRTQRYLQMAQTARRVLPGMDARERHLLERYAEGVNAEISLAADHLPAEFRVLGYRPEPWSAEDALLVAYALAQDLSTGYPYKLSREAVEARLPGDLLADLYPVGSTRDHPPMQDAPSPRPRPGRASAESDDEDQEVVADLRAPEHLRDLLQAQKPMDGTRCADCQAGSNNWAVSGARTLSGKPLLANDPHLGLSVPGVWYTAELIAGDFHVAGASLPGVPFIVIGHNGHVAWGFTNSDADVQDLYIEQIDGDRFLGADGAPHPLQHDRETILVKRGRPVHLDILLTEHGGMLTPVLSPLYPHEKRALALRWALYDAASAGLPLYRANASADGAQLVEAFRNYGTPAQNLVWADDGGHIGYHLVGRVPLRGDEGRSGLAAVPVPTGTYEWFGYIPYEQLPAVTDPAGGVLATANARITGSGYPWPVSLNWGPPYRNERIWQWLSSRTGLTATDMQRLQNDTYSALDKFYAERLASAVEHSHTPSKRMLEAAGILRAWDGRVTALSVAPNLTEAARSALLPMLLKPHLHDAWAAYAWGESSYVLETMLRNQPARWLPPGYANWDELLAAALEIGMKTSEAPGDLTAWTYGSRETVDLEHSLLERSQRIRMLDGLNGTGSQPMNGNAYTVRVSAGQFGVSMRFIADLADLRHGFLSLPAGESGNPVSPWFLDQWQSWYSGRSLPLPFGGDTTGRSADRLELTP